MDDVVRYEAEDGVVVITINRPERLNALNRAVRVALREAFLAFEADRDARVAILTGAGEKSFCAGVDLAEAADTGLRIPPRDFIPVIGDSLDVRKPTIAAVNGYAYAGGWLLAQMCDLCIASENATFAISEVKVGRGVPWAVPLINMLPQRVMLELLMTGDPVGARRLFELGLVNRVVPVGEALSRAREMAQTIAANAPLTVDASKELVRLSTEMGRSAAMRAAYQLFDHVYLSEDALEGPRAFKEKRRPAWKGR